MDANADTDSTDELLFDVKQALRKARPLFPTRRSNLDADDSLGLIAETIVEHLKLCRWQLHRLPPVPSHGIGTREEDDSLGPTPGG